ncbi:MAG: zinc-dependent alcohol dehydrogenase [Candidatus Limnocylindrales bacterium]
MLGVTKFAVGDGHVELREWPDPVAGPGQAVLEVTGAGICGTDLHIWHGEYATVPPVVVGHEVAGRVIAVGPGVPGELIGQRAATESYTSCGACRQCRSGRPNLCASRRSIGTHVNGGFAERIVLPIAGLHALPDRVGDQVAGLCEPLACVCHSLIDSRAVQPGDGVLVIGPGAIGLLAALVARVAGAEVRICGTERDAARLALARKLGIEAFVAGEDPGLEPDVVVECSGSAGGVAYALQQARKGGHLVQMGLSGKPMTVPFDAICLRELRVTSGFAATPLSWLNAMRLLETGKVDMSPLVTGTYALVDWETAFQRSAEASGVKLVFDPQLTA